VLGRFLEIGIRTADIRASVEFYERLGFAQARTGDTWSHPYGVMTDGRLFIGLHQSSIDSPALTFVHADVARHARALEAQGLTLAYQRTAEDEFHSIGLKDPNDQMLVLVEARTFSPVERRAQQLSLCGYFEEYSIPSSDFTAAQAFWEPLGFVATAESDVPYLHLALTSDHLDIAFHRPRTSDQPMLVFRDALMQERLAKLRALAIGTWLKTPAGLDPQANAFLAAPEGTALLFLHDEI
jgi:catechol 2,3-dioxygenase-like lactoylglutathione lyase family enzyme